MLYKIFIVFDDQAKRFMETLMRKKCQKESKPNLLTFDHGDVAQQHCCQKLNTRPGGPLGSYMQTIQTYILPCNIHLSRTSTFFGPQGDHCGGVRLLCLLLLFSVNPSKWFRAFWCMSLVFLQRLVQECCQ